MKHDPLIHAPEGCEEFQRQLSEAVDSGATLTPELRAHFRGCDACTNFAELWLQGPPAELTRSVAAFPDARLRQRILDVASAPDLIPFPALAASRPPWTLWLGRIAAGVALAGFSYWLLNPALTPMKTDAPATSTATPTLTQSLTRMEDRTKHEQQVLQTAVVDGGRQVSGNVLWSVSALDL